MSATSLYPAVVVDTGEEIEVELTPEQAFSWDIGEDRDLGGEVGVVRRIPIFRPPPFGVAVSPNLKVVGWSQPGGVPGATAYMDPYTRRVSSEFNPQGVPLYDSERDLKATAKLTGDQVVHKRLTKEPDAPTERKHVPIFKPKWTRGERPRG